MKTETAEMETRTDEIEDLENLNLSNDDLKTLNLMDDNLFWYGELIQGGKEDFLRQRRNQLKLWLSSPFSENLNKEVKILAEHILLINGKILENYDGFNDLKDFIKTKILRNWHGFHNFLTTEILEQDGQRFKFKTDLDEGKFGINVIDLSQKAIDRFIDSLEATIERAGTRYYTFPQFDEEWKFEDYYNNDTRYIGVKPYKTSSTEIDSDRFVEKKISGSGEKCLKTLFEYWKNNR